MPFVYLMECFPDPTKTFVYREAAAMAELGMDAIIFSVREPGADERAMMEGAHFSTRYFPPEQQLRAEIEQMRNSFSSRQRRALSHWRMKKGDSTRIFEALWLGRELKRLGITHVHAHFAGLAARTAWLTREVWGISYSFTGHADDIFSPEKKPVSLEMIVRHARFIATETDYSRERLERDFPSARGKIFRVFNGMAPTAWEPCEAGDHPPRIVSVGRLVEKKGFFTLLAACAILRERGTAFGCDIVGGGPMEAELRKTASELGLGAFLILHGPQPQSVVHSLLKKARLFALAAQPEGGGGSDNLPTVIMEAMFAGLPVVATRIAGIPEMIEDKETGLLVEPLRADAMATAMESLLTSPAIANKMGANGRAAAIARFDVANSAKALARLLVHRAGVQASPKAMAACPALRATFPEKIIHFLRRWIDGAWR